MIADGRLGTAHRSVRRAGIEAWGGRACSTPIAGALRELKSNTAMLVIKRRPAVLSVCSSIFSLDGGKLGENA